MSFSTYKKFAARKILVALLLLVCAVLQAQTVTNGSLNGGPAANSGINAGNAAGWTVCNFSPDLCSTAFPSYSGNSQVPATASPDGGLWLGIAALGECAQTTITGLTVGNNYTLYFCASCFGTGALYNGSPATPQVCVGTTCQNYSFPQGPGWIPLSLNFTATAATMTLQVKAPSGNFYANFDGFNLVSPCGVPVAPVAYFTATDTTICQGTCVTFTDSSTGSPASWAWSFPGGSTTSSTQQNPGTICYAAPGTYTASLTVSNANGNSTFSRTVRVFAAALTPATAQVCQGDSFLINGVYYTTPGTYDDTLATANGCDSIVRTTLSILPNSTGTQNHTLCPGDSVLINGVYRKTAGVYNDTLQSVNGCDSIVVHDVTLLPAAAGSRALSICAGDSVLINGVYRSTAGAYNDTLTAANGCDSVVTYNLSALAVLTGTQLITLCSGDSVLINGVYRSVAGAYNDTLNSGTGCDSIVTYNLNVIPATASAQNITICAGDSVLINGVYESAAGVYTDTLQNAGGCDSIITYTLSVSQLTATQTFAICAGDSVWINGTYQSTTGTYTDTLSTAAGCDSIVTTNLTVLSQYNYQQSVSVCNGDSVFVNGIYRAQAGVYSDTLTSLSGCDSIITTTVAIKPVPAPELGPDTTICPDDVLILDVTTTGATYLWHSGATTPAYRVTQPGWQRVRVNIDGCIAQDSIWVTYETDGCNCHLYVPNAFTPNGDGNNDTWMVYSNCTIFELRLSLFNRWGEKVYENLNDNQGWDGRFKGTPAPAGVYVYTVTYRLEKGTSSTLHGTLTVIR